MSETGCKADETDGVRSATSIVAQASIEVSQADLDRVLADFTEDELVVIQSTGTRPGDRETFEIRVSEEETLLGFHEACDEHGIVLSIERIYHQKKTETANENDSYR